VDAQEPNGSFQIQTAHWENGRILKNNL
jgi:hypothetical protein